MQPHSRIVFIKGILKDLNIIIRKNLIINICIYTHIHTHTHTHTYAGTPYSHAKLKYLHILKFYHLIPFKQFSH